jgi:hypothetical protein
MVEAQFCVTGIQPVLAPGFPGIRVILQGYLKFFSMTVRGHVTPLLLVLLVSTSCSRHYD